MAMKIFESRQWQSKDGEKPLSAWLEDDFGKTVLMVKEGQKSPVKITQDMFWFIVLLQDKCGF